MHHLAPAPVRPAHLHRPLRGERPMTPRAGGGRDAAALPRLGHPEAEFDLAHATTVRSLSPAPLVPVPPLGPDGVAPPRPGPDLADAVDPSPSILCAALARCVVEILAGARSLDQVARWVSDVVYTKGVVNCAPRRALSRR
ncbi:Rv3235 family protein [Leifsonia virtsii]|uniref:Rv3235 family protein n=1 Tax=Leifsonia virtsii TaxID=3035915 RepID=A0ABT8J085_9MICO|nr:Rv3235 family protein [Leifsonia virtsii]MDN4598493.1 Rv3235 family protein [Leifsonia virtsii]